MVDIVQTRLAAGDYVGAIQAELGNSGASVTLGTPQGSPASAETSNEGSPYLSQPATLGARV
jgi:hypothetical protein